MVCKYGRTGTNMMDTTKQVNFMVRGSLCLPMGTCIMVNGSIVRHMGRARILIPMVISMKVSSSAMYNKDTARRLGRMAHIILAIFIKGLSMGGAPSSGQIIVGMKAIGKIIKWTAKAPTSGPTEKNIMGLG